MRIFATLAFAVSALTITPALAKDKKPADPDKKICRRLEVTGSILGGKATCRTKAEWAAIDEANSADAKNFDDMRRAQRGMGTQR